MGESARQSAASTEPLSRVKTASEASKTWPPILNLKVLGGLPSFCVPGKQVAGDQPVARIFSI
jgi:hypothetical protein